MRVRLAWSTDPGLQREENEDAVVVRRNKAGLDALIVVCDGMGGHVAGRLASSIASETFVKVMEGDGGKGPDPSRLRAASDEANAAVHSKASADAALTGMGSTLTVVAIDDDEIGIVNVGDSPAYLFRDGEAVLISQDHSWPAEQVRLGLIQPEDAKDHPMKHRLTRAIGVWDRIQSYTNRIKARPGDTLVLCSDGIETAGVSVEEMWELLYGNDLEAGIERVFHKCKQLGAPDNITLAVARFEEGGDRKREQPEVEKTALLKTLKPEDLERRRKD